MDSRRTRKLTQETKKRLLLNLIGIFVLIFLVFKFGIPLLINFALFLSSGKNQQSQSQQKISSFLQPPILNALYSATNSATITLNGTATLKTTVRLFADNNYIDAVQAKDDGSYVFKDVVLHDGQNTFTVKAKNEKTQSDFSNPLVITYQAKAPNLTIDSPTDGQSFSKDDTSITVRGKTDPDVKVTVNDFWAITDDKGNYSYSLQLKNGDNQIKVDAIDSAGNKTEKVIKATSSQ